MVQERRFLSYSILSSVNLNDIEVIDVLGPENADNVTKVRWNQQQAAMKQFRVGRVGRKRFHYSDLWVQQSMGFNATSLLLLRLCSEQNEFGSIFFGSLFLSLFY